LYSSAPGQGAREAAGSSSTIPERAASARDKHLAVGQQGWRSARTGHFIRAPVAAQVPVAGLYQLRAGQLMDAMHPPATSHLPVGERVAVFARLNAGGIFAVGAKLGWPGCYSSAFVVPKAAISTWP